MFNVIGQSHQTEQKSLEPKNTPLPDELYLHIFSFLYSPMDQQNLVTLNQHFRTLIIRMACKKETLNIHQYILNMSHLLSSQNEQPYNKAAQKLISLSTDILSVEFNQNLCQFKKSAESIEKSIIDVLKHLDELNLNVLKRINNEHPINPPFLLRDTIKCAHYYRSYDLAKNETNPWIKDFYVQISFKGLARAGDFTGAIKVAEEGIHLQKNLVSIIKYLLKAKKFDFAETIAPRITDESLNIYHKIAEAAALNGDEKRAVRLIDKIPFEPSRKAILALISEDGAALACKSCVKDCAEFDLQDE